MTSRRWGGRPSPVGGEICRDQLPNVRSDCRSSATDRAPDRVEVHCQPGDPSLLPYSIHEICLVVSDDWFIEFECRCGDDRVCQSDTDIVLVERLDPALDFTSPLCYRRGEIHVGESTQQPFELLTIVLRLGPFPDRDPQFRNHDSRYPPGLSRPFDLSGFLDRCRTVVV